MGEKTAMQSKVMLSIVCVCVGGAQNSISPRATKGLEPALCVCVCSEAERLQGDVVCPGHHSNVCVILLD